MSDTAPVSLSPMELALQNAQEGLAQAQRDMQAAADAHAQAVARLNYFKGAVETLAPLVDAPR